MSDKPKNSVLTTSFQLQDAVEELSARTRTLDGIRDKIARLERQRADVLEQVFSGKEVPANSLNASLNHKFKTQKAALLRAQKDHEHAWLTYSNQLAAFEQMTAKNSRRMAEGAADALALRQCSGALHRVFEGMVNRRLKSTAASVESDFELPEQSYDYIPFPIQRYLETLMRMDEYLSVDPDYAHGTLRYRPVAFLEVGCGTGRNLLLTRLSQLILLNRCAGFDLNDELIAVGQTGLDLEDEIFVADALQFDYSPYDVLFSYRPLKTPDAQAALEEIMVASMRDSAYLIAPMAENLDKFPELTCVNKSMDLWKKTG